MPQRLISSLLVDVEDDGRWSAATSNVTIVDFDPNVAKDLGKRPGKDLAPELRGEIRELWEVSERKGCHGRGVASGRLVGEVGERHSDQSKLDLIKDIIDEGMGLFLVGRHFQSGTSQR